MCLLARDVGATLLLCQAMDVPCMPNMLTVVWMPPSPSVPSGNKHWYYIRHTKARRRLTEVVSVLDTIEQRLLRSDGNQRFELHHSIEARYLSMFTPPFELLFQDMEGGHNVP